MAAWKILSTVSLKSPLYSKGSYIHKYVPLKSLRLSWCRLLLLCVCTFIYIPVLLCLEIYTSIVHREAPICSLHYRQRKELYQPSTRQGCRILFLSLGVILTEVRLYPSRVFIIHHLFVSWILIKKSYTIS